MIVLSVAFDFHSFLNESFGNVQDYMVIVMLQPSLQMKGFVISLV